MVKLVFERDSVCAGDDINAPNPKEFYFDQIPSLREVICEETIAKYLPSVSDARTFWTVICGGVEIAYVEHSASSLPQAKIKLLDHAKLFQPTAVLFRYEKQECMSP